jgi:hypothetical protein
LRLPARRRSIAATTTAAAAAPPPATPLLVGSGRPCRFSARPFPRSLRARDDRHDPGQAARPAPAGRLLARARVDLLDPFVELGQPFFDRPLDLRTRGARLLGPDARPFGTNGFRRGVGVGRLGIDRDLRREFRHLEKS